MTDLAALAARYGVLTSYEDWAGNPKQVPEETVRRVLDAMGAFDGDPEDAAPLTVVREGTPEARGLPVGEHDRGDGGTLLVAPRACPQPPRTWGWMAQLYAVRSRDSWGLGDFGDLARLCEWSARDAGAGFVLVNPLHATSPGLPQENSPYFPASRRFLNPIYLDVEALPELDRMPADQRDEVLRLATEARALNAADRIDRDAVYRLKWQAFEQLFEYAQWWPEVEDYRTRGGQPLEDFATWSALAEVHRGPYQEWPEPLRDPDGAAVTRARDELAERVAFHTWLQLRCAGQLAAAQQRARDAGMPVGLVLDLAVGVDPGGADAWAQQDVLAQGMTVGAPPDSFNQKGQDWRLPPWRPDRLRATGYAPFREMVRATTAQAGGIRIDHAMGLFRLFWVPDGMSPAEGTYVRYPAGDLLGILVYECHRAGAVAVAEDLGTVEPGVPETLRDNGILGSAVLWFEEGGSAAYPEKAFTSVTTHDLPTARGFWTDEALKVQEELDLLGRPVEDQRADNAAERARVRGLLDAEGLAGESTDDLVAGMHEFVGRTPSLMVAVALGDAVGDPRQPNMPGTKDEYPNWRLPLPVPLEDLAVDDVVAAVRRGRSRGPAAR
ncbi:MAG TPA: 4-alpha-glucanotransferase [Frankiaceae bacterium]|nr:4-alpha-glucanotransferase [Frankiaceae bacterium]